jgi:predicted AlkP superfamily phosphohydrolase/phosphomutase
LARIDTSEIYKTAFENRIKSELSSSDEFYKKLSDIYIEDVRYVVQYLQDEYTAKISSIDNDKNIKDSDKLKLLLKQEYGAKISEMIKYGDSNREKAKELQKQYSEQYKSDLDKIEEIFNAEVHN